MIKVRPLTVENFSQFGWLLGKTVEPAFSSAKTDFREEHVFDPGVGGETQLLWVNYRDNQSSVSSLEAHTLTQQAVIPLTGDIIQIVAAARPDKSPDLSTLSAFRVSSGQGICMRVGCWHATRVDQGEVTSMMLTRRSTTLDLIAHLTTGSALSESAINSMGIRDSGSGHVD